MVQGLQTFRKLVRELGGVLLLGAHGQLRRTGLCQCLVESDDAIHRPFPSDSQSAVSEGESGFLLARARAEALGLYQRLQGIQELERISSGIWDIAVQGNLLIEVDEENHFNRHRAATLDGTGFPWTADYLRYCGEYESRCRTNGRFWTSTSSEAMFGPASPRGDHTGVGAPRWRQRALYDAVRDVWAQGNPGWRLGRLSIYDVVDGVRFNDVLEGRKQMAPDRLRELIEARTLG